MMLFRQGKQDEGYAKYQEIVDKDYASTRYRNIKEQLKARKSSARERLEAGRRIRSLAARPRHAGRRSMVESTEDPDVETQERGPMMVADGFKHLRLGKIGDVVLVEVTSKEIQGPDLAKEFIGELNGGRRRGW